MHPDCAKRRPWYRRPAAIMISIMVSTTPGLTHALQLCSTSSFVSQTARRTSGRSATSRPPWRTRCASPSSPTDPIATLSAGPCSQMMLYGCAQKEVMGLDVRRRHFAQCFLHSASHPTTLPFGAQKAVEECSASMPATTKTVPFLTLVPFASQNIGCRATASRPT